MEVAGLALGAVGVAIVGVAALYRTCFQTLEQIDTARHLEKAASLDDSSPLLPLGKTVRILYFSARDCTSFHQCIL
jgi:hypothetical protein